MKTRKTSKQVINENLQRVEEYITAALVEVRNTIEVVDEEYREQLADDLNELAIRSRMVRKSLDLCF